MNSTWIAVYCWLSSLVLSLLGLGWRSDNAPHRAIKFGFLFLSVWGVFFGALIIKHAVQP